MTNLDKLQRVEASLHGRQVVVQLFQRLGADDDAHREGLLQDVGERDAGDRRAMGVAHLAHDFNAFPGAVLVHRREIEGDAAAPTTPNFATSWMRCSNVV